MASLKPHWTQPSHPDRQQVVINEVEFASKSLSRITLPPFALFARMTFPPCTAAAEATYATVQIGPDEHLNLNSDLLYINHSCEPSLIFDTADLSILAGPQGLRQGDELTFFYPSTEWSMAQPFNCTCATPACRGRIAGAEAMSAAQLRGVWLNGHIRARLDARDRSASDEDGADATAQALREALRLAEKTAAAARAAVRAYGDGGRRAGDLVVGGVVGRGAAAGRRGPTSRELAGEMGGDTAAQVGA